MPNSELASMLRSIIQEELQPVNARLEQLEKEQQEFRQEVNTRLTALDEGQVSLKQGQINLDKGQKKLQRDVTLIRKELKESWKDIGNFDDRITTLEKMVIR